MSENQPIIVPEGVLRSRANFLGVDADEYLAMTPKQRNIRRTIYIKALRKDAQNLDLDPDTHVNNRMAEWPRGPDTDARDEKLAKQKARIVRRQAASEEHKGQTLTLITDEKMEEIRKKARRAVDGEFEKPKLDPPYVDEDGIRVYTTGDGEVPPAEEDPKKRDGVTVGSIREIEKPPVDDLVGDRPPRTITDLYARWPIADDHNYSIRIERTKPKRHAGVDVAGFVGEIRGCAMSEADIQRWLGGNEYLLTVYGPDPRGKTDLSDLPIIKPLTEPIKLIVPVLPPNTSAIPAVNQGKTEMSQNLPNPMNPFGPTVSAPMTNQHDATIHKTNTEFGKSVMQMQREDANKRERAEAAANTSLIQFMTAQTAAQTEAIREDAKSRERIVEKQLEMEREERRKSEEKMDALAKAFEEKTGKGFDVESLTKLLHTVGPNREAESQRQSEYYRMQMETMKTSHEESMKQLRDRNSDELRRADERIKDTESFYKRMLEDERSKANDREKELRSQMETMRREVKDDAEKRISDMKERHESELRQAEKSHERELRTLKESWDTKIDVADRTHQMQVEQISERLQDAQSDAASARAEAKENADPAKVLEKAKAQAEALGYEKSDSTPKTAMERFAATAGAGLSQALANIDSWGPQAMAAMRGAPPAGLQQMPPQLPPGPSAAQQRRFHPNAPPGGSPQPHPQPEQPSQKAPVNRRRSRAAVWATENVTPMNTPEVPSTPLGFQNPEAVDRSHEEDINAVAENVPVAESQETEQVQNVADPSTVPEMEQQTPPLPEKFTNLFAPPIIFAFLAQIENHINLQTDPDIFAEQFMLQFPEEATKMVTNIEHSDVSDTVRGIPGSEASPILRRDGEKWLESLWSSLRKRAGSIPQNS